MNDTEITALAREYAEFTDTSDVEKKYISAICENFLRYTLRRYRLVEKECVNEAYKGAIETIQLGEETGAYSLCTFGSARRILLESFFPDLGKEAEG